MSPVVPFGKKFRDKYFPNLDKEAYPLNHGSYGLTPQPVHEEYIRTISKEAEYPDRYIRYDLPDKYVGALKSVGEFVNCDYRDLALVDNATTGINTVLRSFPFEKGDKVLMMSTVYGSCGNTVKFLQEYKGIEYQVVEINYPIKDDEIVDKIEEIFKTQLVKMCMFDTVSSMPGIRFPFEKMVKLCKKYQVISLVDGAHCIGLIPFNLGELQPDFFVSNLHKWLFVPRGCAMLYVDTKYHDKVQTLPISHSYTSDNLVDKFAFIGSKNYASIACIESAIEFRKGVCGGERAIYEYCLGLSEQVAKRVKEIWGDVEVLGVSGALVTVEVPMANPRLFDDGNLVKQCEEYVYGAMIRQYNTYVPMIYHNGKIFARFSCQIYNELHEYEYASRVILEIFDNFFKSLNK